MFIIMLRFSNNKAQASLFIEGHNEWIKRGFDDGVFLMAGSLQPNLGGAVIAHGLAKEALERRVNEDPFVIENIVTAEIIAITPKRADERLEFLLI